MPVMQYALFLVATLSVAQTEPLGPGDHKRIITVDELKRRHSIHVPSKYDAKKPAPVVLVLHGAVMDGKRMEFFSGMSKTADEHNFIAVYPNGERVTWNAGTFPGPDKNSAD